MGNKIQRIYIGTNLVRPKWHPGANTLAYYPLTANANDFSGNGRNGTAQNTTFSTANGAYFVGGQAVGSNGVVTTPTMTMGTTYTINTWMKAATALTSYKEIDIHRRWTGGNLYVLFYANTSGLYFIFGNGSSSGSTIGGSYSIGTAWHNIALVREGATGTIYVDGTSLATGNSTYNVDPQSFCFGNDLTNSAIYASSSYFKDYFIENKARTATEITEYFNLTKSNYGL